MATLLQVRATQQSRSPVLLTDPSVTQERKSSLKLKINKNNIESKHAA